MGDKSFRSQTVDHKDELCGNLNHEHNMMEKNATYEHLPFRVQHLQHEIWSIA